MIRRGLAPPDGVTLSPVAACGEYRNSAFLHRARTAEGPPIWGKDVVRVIADNTGAPLPAGGLWSMPRPRHWGGGVGERRLGQRVAGLRGSGVRTTARGPCLGAGRLQPVCTCRAFQSSLASFERPDRVQCPAPAQTKDQLGSTAAGKALHKTFPAGLGSIPGKSGRGLVLDDACLEEVLLFLQIHGLAHPGEGIRRTVADR